MNLSKLPTGYIARNIQLIKMDYDHAQDFKDDSAFEDVYRTYMRSAGDRRIQMISRIHPTQRIALDRRLAEEGIDITDFDNLPDSEGFKESVNIRRRILREVDEGL